MAPSRDFVAVPSRATSAASRPAWSAASRPRTDAAISPLTWATARSTPLPCQRAESPYNQLIRIEEELGDSARYAGRTALRRA